MYKTVVQYIAQVAEDVINVIVNFSVGHFHAEQTIDYCNAYKEVVKRWKCQQIYMYSFG